MRKHFDFYGYTSPPAGVFYIGQVPYTYGEDFRNVRRYKEYKNVGFNVLLLQHENSYDGEDFQTSACKKCMDLGYKAGLDRIIVSDKRLKELCVTKNLIGEDGKFKTEKEFLDYLDFCTAPYRTHAGFFGVQLYDEPRGEFLKPYGMVYRGLKKLIPDVYLECNLFPICGLDYLNASADNDYDAYEKYLNEFVKEAKPDGIQFDDYPFLREYVLGVNTLRSYQIAARVCKENDIELRSIMQSFSFFSEDHLIHRRITEQDMYWQMNLALGFGCKEFAYYTYFTKINVAQIKGEKFEKAGCIPIHLTGYPVVDGVDGAAFINRDGSRTNLYNYTKRIISEFKQFEEVILDYKYKNSYIFIEKGKTKNDFMQTRCAEENEGCAISVTPSYGTVLCTEMEKDGSVMYMVENINNVKDELFDKKVFTAKIHLGELAEGAEFYFRGKKVDKKVNDGVLKLKLRCGDAIFIKVNKK